MLPSEPLIAWTEALAEWLGFLAAYLAAGAIGFRFAVLRPFLAAQAPPEERHLARQLAARVAWLGASGTGLAVGLFLLELRGAAAEEHLAPAALIQSLPAVQIQIACLTLAAIGFVLAARHRRAGWRMAAIGVVASPFRGLAGGDLPETIALLHELAGGLWIGTLFYLAVCAIPAVLRSGLSTARRGAAVAALVRAFSPLALGAVPVLGILGVIMAWRNLHGLQNLWSTPYGYTLLVKLGLVATVLGLGAWNWRRHSPRLGTENTARRLWRSAAAELSIAGVVLLVTAILVSLSYPEPPGR